MARQFYRVKFATIDQHVAINASFIRAILPLGKDKYRIWLAGEIEIPAEASKRDPKLAGVTALSKDWWEVKSSDLAELFG
jgi:hypothetical protein